PPTRHVAPPARKPHVAVQHDVDAPFAPPWSHASLPSGSLMPLPQIGSGAIDQPESLMLSSSTFALQLIGFTVAALAPPAPWKPIVAVWPSARSCASRYLIEIALDPSWMRMWTWTSSLPSSLLVLVSRK